MKLTRINNKWNIWLPDHRADRPEWGWWEKERLERMHSTTVPGDVVYYVGAEEGDMAGLLAMWGAKLALFEPNEKVWPNIKVIWDKNDLPLPLACFSGFASNKTIGNGFIHLDDVHGDLIGDHGFKELHDPGIIPQVRIDDLTLLPPNMISIDVEGSEWEVLRGAEQTLKKYHPRIFLSLHPEFLFRIYGEYQFDLRKWIKDLGYTEKLLAFEHEIHLYYE